MAGGPGRGGGAGRAADAACAAAPAAAGLAAVDAAGSATVHVASAGLGQAPPTGFALEPAAVAAAVVLLSLVAVAGRRRAVEAVAVVLRARRRVARGAVPGRVAGVAAEARVAAAAVTATVAAAAASPLPPPVRGVPVGVAGVVSGGGCLSRAGKSGARLLAGGLLRSGGVALLGALQPDVGGGRLGLGGGGRLSGRDDSGRGARLAEGHGRPARLGWRGAGGRGACWRAGCLEGSHEPVAPKWNADSCGETGRRGSVVILPGRRHAER
mmetsp:Transcript_11292/g.43588  ORF Transcript_11292/g.43588 Transcript_11292/m.43588 type:complete len:269 (-) Transcript_11292:648-1454(-)